MTSSKVGTAGGGTASQVERRALTAERRRPVSQRGGGGGGGGGGRRTWAPAAQRHQRKHLQQLCIMGGVFDLLEHWSLSSESRRALMDTPYTHCQAERRQSKQLKEGSVQLYICDLLQEGLFSIYPNKCRNCVIFHDFGQMHLLESVSFPKDIGLKDLLLNQTETSSSSKEPIDTQF